MQVKSFSKERWANADSERLFVKFDPDTRSEMIVVSTKGGDITIRAGSDGRLVVTTSGAGFDISPSAGNEFTFKRSKR